MLARMQKVSRSAHKFSNSRPGEGEIQRLFRNSFQIWQSENAELEQIVCGFPGGPHSSFATERALEPADPGVTDGNLELALTLNSLEEIIPLDPFLGKRL